MSRNWKMIKCLVLMLVMQSFLVFFMGKPIYAIEKTINIMIIHSYDLSYSWTFGQDEGIRNTILQAYPKANIYIENLDSKRISEDYIMSTQKDNFVDKYSSMQFDLVLATDDIGLEFAIKVRDELQIDIPIAFSGVQENAVDILVGDSKNITGVYEIRGFTRMIELMRILQPEAKKVIIINDRSSSSKQMVEKILIGFDTLKVKDNYVLEFWEDKAYADILEDVSMLEKDTAVYLISYFVSADGVTKDGKVFSQEISKVSSVPMYSLGEIYFGAGITGGEFLSPQLQGKELGEIAINILEGIPVKDIPYSSKSTSYLGVDENMIRKYNLEEFVLPKDTVVINERFSFYESYTFLIWSVLLGFLVLVSFIGVLLSQKRIINITNKNLVKSEKKYSSYIENAPNAIFIIDKSGRYLDVNKTATMITGYSREELLNMSMRDLTAEESQIHLLELFEILLEEGSVSGEFQYIYKNSLKRWWSIDSVKLNENMYLCFLSDITNQKDAEMELLDSEKRYRYLFEHSGVGIGYYTTDGVVISYNRIALENIGGKSEDYIGKSIKSLFPKEEAEKYLARIEKAISSDNSQEYEDYLVFDSCPKWFSSTFTKVMNATGAVIGVQIASLDITNRKQAESESLYLSFHDHLTDLYNRRYFEEEIDKFDVKDNLPLSIIMVDTNGLKITNDSFGHNMGDVLLKKAAFAIKQGCREEDIIVRYGGDEFVIVLPNTSTDEALKIATSIKEIASKEKVANIELSISYGYATKHSISESITDIMANAENHMYSYKLSERSSMRSKQIEIIMNTLFEKSQRESQHSTRVSKICEAIAVNMKFENQEVNKMRIAGLVHDIGKIGIDEKILNKTGDLDNDEWNEMKKHSEAGWRILSSSNEFAELAQYVLHHHERWDGNGYPNKLKGENIPHASRIIAVADAYDAMTSERSYRKAIDKDTAIEELKRCSGKQFDPKIIDVFVNQVLTDNNDFND